MSTISVDLTKNEIINELIQIVKDYINDVSFEIDENTSLVDIIDSLDVVLIITDIEKIWNISFHNDDMTTIRNIKDLYNRLLNYIQPKN